MFADDFFFSVVLRVLWWLVGLEEVESGGEMGGGVFEFVEERRGGRDGGVSGGVGEEFYLVGSGQGWTKSAFVLSFGRLLSTHKSMIITALNQLLISKPYTALSIYNLPISSTITPINTQPSTGTDKTSISIQITPELLSLIHI